MNERIRELVRESHLDVYGLGKERYKWEYTVEKFAELIVQECLLSLEPDLYSKEIDYEFEQRFYKRCRDKIIKHFGVEQ